MNLPVKLMLVSMEQLNILDVGNVHHIGAVQSLLKPVMQHALDMLKDTRTTHTMCARHGGMAEGLTSCGTSTRIPEATPLSPKGTTPWRNTRVQTRVRP